MGHKLIEKLQSNQYSVFRFIVAYAKTSGVNRLLPYMRAFKESEGRILGVVGIDQGNTSYEALMSLRAVCDELYVYHSEDIMRTFHVKAYHFSGAESPWLAVGSNNFTAGGLFGNYEAGITARPNDVQNLGFLKMFAAYSDVSSPCCRAASAPFIDALLENHYIQREQALARRRIAETAPRRARGQGEILFGRDINAALPPAEARGQTAAAPPAAIQPGGGQAAAAPAQGRIAGNADYLIRHVPRAGGRSKQVHFTMDILEQYFGMRPGDELDLQQISDIYTPHLMENRRIIFSETNRNVKIEIAAAEILNDHYPEDPNKRPVLLFKRVNPAMFEYMLLMDGDAGYDSLNQRLLSLDWHYKSLPYEMVDMNTMLTVWKDCPLI